MVCAVRKRVCEAKTDAFVSTRQLQRKDVATVKLQQATQLLQRTAELADDLLHLVLALSRLQARRNLSLQISKKIL